MHLSKITLLTIIAILSVNSIPKANAFLSYSKNNLRQISFLTLDQDGVTRETSLEEFKGKFIILNFWASWCIPCVAEMPSLEMLHYDLAQKNNLEVIAISIDHGGMKAVNDFYKKNNITYLNYYVDRMQNLMSSFNASTVPTTIFLNRNGEEIDRVTGYADWDSNEAREYVKDLLEEADLKNISSINNY